MFIAPCLVEVRACAIQSCLEEMSLLFFPICWHKVSEGFLLFKTKKAGRGKVTKAEELLSADEHV